VLQNSVRSWVVLGRVTAVPLCATWRRLYNNLALEGCDLLCFSSDRYCSFRSWRQLKESRRFQVAHNDDSGAYRLLGCDDAQSSLLCYFVVQPWRWTQYFSPKRQWTWHHFPGGLDGRSIHGVPAGRISILAGHSMDYSKHKSVYVHVSYSEIDLLHCTDEQHAMTSHELQSALMLTVVFSKLYYTG
jgi:hypothetical protein